MGSKVTLQADDYVLGTRDAEIERLGLQHRVWRHRVLDCWRHARIAAGHRVADIGAGPGFASVDLAELVGPGGRVIALERSEYFLDALRDRIAQHRLANVDAHRIDLDSDDLGVSELDATWCRWVLSFVRDPGAVVRKISDALRPAGCAVFHEYLDYRAWRILPPLPSHDRFVDAVMLSWRAAGGEPDIALQLPSLLAKTNLRIVAAEPVTYLVAPNDPMWAWPEAFLMSGADRLVELGHYAADAAAELKRAFTSVKADPATRMLTPVVLEVIAVKNADPRAAPNS